MKEKFPMRETAKEIFDAEMFWDNITSDYPNKSVTHIHMIMDSMVDGDLGIDKEMFFKMMTLEKVLTVSEYIDNYCASRSLERGELNDQEIIEKMNSVDQQVYVIRDLLEQKATILDIYQEVVTLNDEILGRGTIDTIDWSQYNPE